MVGKRHMFLCEGGKKDYCSKLLEFLLAILLLCLSACGQSVSAPSDTPAPTLKPGESQHTLNVSGLERSYLLHVPPGLDGNHPVPLVFVLHGYDSEIHFEISDMQNMSGFNEIADKSGFIEVYPSGVNGVWNAGSCCGTAVENNVAEISFFRQILVDLGKTFNLDTKRIYATGFSMGGLMAFRLACEMSDTFAAIAPVAGALVLSPCQPGQPVSIMQVHGKQDTAIPYAGGLGGLMTGKYTFPAVEASLALWAQLDGCSSATKTDQVGIAVHTVYPGCKAGSSIELYTIDAMGSNWPSQYVLPVSQMIWDFFKTHPKK